MKAAPKSARKEDGEQVPPADERDAIIARLERGLAAEKENAAVLRAAVEDHRFKLDVLERSYAKQLADARSRADARDKELAELQRQLAAVGPPGADLAKLLADAHDDLVHARAELARARQAPKERSGRFGTGSRQHADATHETGLTINKLMADLTSLRESHARADGMQSEPAASAEPELIEPMIAPELVFTKGAKEQAD